MSTQLKNSNNDQFISSMIQSRGIEFANIGMRVEIDGKIGTIKGFNIRANLDVVFDSNLKSTNKPRNCHPTWNIKYFDKDGNVIAHFIESTCVFRPEKRA